jgi:hypothetical protein
LRASALALVVASLALAGCETTAQKSARLERQAGHVSGVEQGLTVKRPGRAVKIVSTTVVHSAEGAAAIVRVRNVTARPLRDVPLAITVSDARGQVLSRNDAPGLEGALVAVPSLPAHGELSWVDDQLGAGGDPAKLSALAGEATAAGALPRLSLSGLKLDEEGAGGAAVSGRVTNRSAIAQRGVVVFATAWRGRRAVAGGRAVVPELAAHGSAAFQALLIGDARSAALAVSAPATTFQ